MKLKKWLQAVWKSLHTEEYIEEHSSYESCYRPLFPDEQQPKKLWCPLCGYSATRQDWLDAHIQNDHKK